MACTTILVGKKASYDGSTMIARNDDSGSGHFTPKKFVVVQPQEQPRHYESVISHVKIELPEQPMRYTAVPGMADGGKVSMRQAQNEAHADGDGDDHLESARARRRSAGGIPEGRGWSAGDMWRDRRGRSRASLYPGDIRSAREVSDVPVVPRWSSTAPMR